MSSLSVLMDEVDVATKVTILMSLGFLDEGKNREALARFHNNLNDAAGFLLDPDGVGDTSGDLPFPSSPPEMNVEVEQNSATTVETETDAATGDASISISNKEDFKSELPMEGINDDNIDNEQQVPEDKANIPADEESWFETLWLEENETQPIRLIVSSSVSGGNNNDNDDRSMATSGLSVPVAVTVAGGSNDTTSPSKESSSAVSLTRLPATAKTANVNNDVDASVSTKPQFPPPHDAHLILSSKLEAMEIATVRARAHRLRFEGFPRSAVPVRPTSASTSQMASPRHVSTSATVLAKFNNPHMNVNPATASSSSSSTTRSTTTTSAENNFPFLRNRRSPFDFEQVDVSEAAKYPKPHERESTLESYYRMKRITGKTRATPSSDAPLSLTVEPRVITAFPAEPPNWSKHCEETIMSFSTFKTFPVPPGTNEYKMITAMLDPFQVTSVSQIVNPDLWQRFTNTRREMLRSKSEDLDLLAQLGCDNIEIQRRAHLSANFVKTPHLTSNSAKYSPNEVLLFHCTKSERNLDQILSQGLDERLSRLEPGRLGNGIYFADDPLKAVQYDGGTGTILIFSVLLGDCLSVAHLENKCKKFVREPEKLPAQKRNVGDQFFDSITGRPGRHNEFVVFNRYQCCPLYMVRYQRPPMELEPFFCAEYPSSDNNGLFARARRGMPTVAWRTLPGYNNGPPMPNQYLDLRWPFFASGIFKKMGEVSKNSAATAGMSSSRREYEYDMDGAQAQIEGAAALPPERNLPTGIITDELEAKHLALGELGFFDKEKNLEALRRYNGDLDQAANFLFEAEASGPKLNNRQQRQQPYSTFTESATNTNSSESTANTSSMIPEKNQANLEEAVEEAVASTAGAEADSSTPQEQALPEKEDCLICYSEYSSFAASPYSWKRLQCDHKLCVRCFNSILGTAVTMSHVRQTSIRCPFCQQITGLIVGDCPDGSMNVSSLLQSCDGYPTHHSIKITYQLNIERRFFSPRTAYLPGTEEGYEVLKLLKVAWDRRLIFTIGTSNTTGAVNVPVWNIHHKTSLGGGAAAHGYPDPGYLARVRLELKSYGIE